MTPKLPADVAAKYSLSPKLKGGPTFDFGRYGKINISQLSVKMADQLFATGFPHLSKKKQKAKPKAEKADTTTT